MNELTNQVSEVVRSVWRRRWLAATVAWLVALVGAGVVWLVPNRYEATARVYVDTQTVLKPLMAGLAFQPDIEQQVRMLARTLISRPNIERLIAQPDVAVVAKDERERERAIDDLQLKIKVDHSGGNLFQISYRDPQPNRAKAVVTGLVNMFVDSGFDTKQRDSKEASKFIDDQIQEYERKLVETENRLKDFKIRNFGVSGVSNQDYFARMSALSDDVGRLRVALAAAEQGRDALRRELSSEQPQLPSEPAPVQQQTLVLPTPPSEVDARLESQGRQLDDLLRRYTDEHPDVVNVRRTIAMLEQQKRREIEAKAKAEAAAAAVAASEPRTSRAANANNPVFQRLRVSLAEAEANVASLRSQLSAQSERLDQIRSTASKVPQAEAELAQLNRDYEIIRRKYEELVSRREAASLGVKIDQSSQLAEFRVVEPPRIAPRAVFPDRVVLAVVAMIAALALGIVSAYFLSRFLPSIDSVRALQELTKRPVLGTISMNRTPEARTRAQRDAVGFAFACGLFFISHGAWLFWIAQRSPVY